ncbi:MAG: hypothetical protein JNK87_04560 [Bryobacterales bacterium]|nr:hypothetical protein [Bryobacterales bacterium]
MSRTLACLIVFLTLPATSALAGTIVLTFSAGAGTCASDSAGTTGPIPCSDSNRIYQGYGDTADVDFTYLDFNTAPNSLYWWSTQYNQLVDVAWADEDGRIEIAPTASALITLDHLDIGSWLGVMLPVTVRVLDLVTSEELYNTGVLNIGATSVYLTPGVSSRNGLALVWDATTGGGRFGLDNITITAETVPEPRSGILIAAGLFCLVCAGTRWGDKTVRDVTAD